MAPASSSFFLQEEELVRRVEESPNLPSQQCYCILLAWDWWATQSPSDWQSSGLVAGSHGHGRKKAGLPGNVDHAVLRLQLSAPQMLQPCWPALSHSPYPSTVTCEGHGKREGLRSKEVPVFFGSVF